MTPILRTCAAALVALTFLPCSAHADEGMWLLNHPPLQTLRQKYKFEPTPQWLEHVQKSCVRFSTGGSGSIVSADGLVMTNHHVGSEILQKLSTPQKNLLETGFYARTQQEERKAEDLELHCLWSIEDVTERVKGAAASAKTPSESFAAMQKAIAAIEEQAEKATGLDCEVVTLYNGGLYHLYSYKRYTDVRLVMAPEADIASFGGDNDNFEYPRFNLDMCFFRIYENGKPLKPAHYLKWSKAGSKDGDLALVFGHPARTQRLDTLDNLKFYRDVDLPFTLRYLWRREVELQSFAQRSDENKRIADEEIGSVRNSRKAITGIMQGMLDPAVMKRKADDESKLRAAVNSDPQRASQWSDAWEQIAAAQRNFGEFYTRYTVLEGRRGLRSDLYGFARKLVRLADELPKPSGERLREFRDSELDSLYLELFSPAPIYDDLEIARLRDNMAAVAQILGADDPAVKLMLATQSPQDRAFSLVKGSKLKDVAYRKKLAEGGKKAIADSDDPIIRLAASLEPEARALRKRHEDEVESVERDAYAKIAAARFAIYGDTVYPDATFTLRMSFGPVRGYKEVGHDVPPYTTLGGTYERMNERHGQPPFKLPKRWLDRKDKLDLSTPFNFVSTPDIIGGNSGSPVVNTNGEVIGLIFDGNIQSLIWDIVYTQEQGRAVSVDSRAILECLRKVYDARALADELTGH